MKSILVTSDRDYEVVIDTDWQKAVEPYLSLKQCAIESLICQLQMRRFIFSLCQILKLVSLLLLTKKFSIG